MKYSLTILLLCAAICSRSEAVIALNAPTGDFVAVPLNGASDPFLDEQSQGKGLDLVGGVGGFDAFYVGFNDNGGASATDGELVFRVRLGGAKHGAFSSFVDVGLDIDGGGLDYIIQFAGQNPNEIQIFRATGTTANNTALGVALYPELAESVEYLAGGNAATANAYFAAVSDVTDVAPDPDFSGDVTDIDENDGTDYFLTFSLDFNYLVQVVRADATSGGLDSGYQLFDDTFTFGMLVTTSQDGNNVNGDFGGINGNEAGSGDVPFVSVGGDPSGPGLSSPFLPDGAAFVPEPRTYALLLGFGVLLCGIFGKR